MMFDKLSRRFAESDYLGCSLLRLFYPLGFQWIDAVGQFLAGLLSAEPCLLQRKHASTAEPHTVRFVFEVDTSTPNRLRSPKRRRDTTRAPQVTDRCRSGGRAR